jgi:crotonobetainyl-CoA:carnitine CoA-transferase CaiB-like acyl-CoA transferase
MSGTDTAAAKANGQAGVLSAYRVLDCSIAMAGSLAAQRLGDLGADMIKIEPLNGEWQRRVTAGGAKGNRINVSVLPLNRNKRSLAVDLRSRPTATPCSSS